MNPSTRFSSSWVRPALGLALATALLAAPQCARPQLVSSGYPVASPEWQMLITDRGYADLALDNRPGFLGREYLSGEWAAAVHYRGGQDPSNAIWLERQWIFPDWQTDSDFGVESPVRPGGTNDHGFVIYSSAVTNRDLRITMTYEMLDTTNGIAMGLEPRSAAGAGTHALSSRYVFRQTYALMNIAPGPLTNVRFYQFMHGLEMTNSLYDDRLYPAGAFPEYQHDITQQGRPFSIDTRTGEIVRHFDLIAFHSRATPDAWENGYFGRRGMDSHLSGKPAVGVHGSVETNVLNGVDAFTPPEMQWVAGAQCFEWGTLDAGASVTNDVLFSVKSTEVVAFPGVNVVIRQIATTNSHLAIAFEETIGGPLGFILHTSADVAGTNWTQVPLPYTIGFPKPGWNQFEVPIVPGEAAAFYRIQAVIQNDP